MTRTNYPTVGEPMGHFYFMTYGEKLKDPRWQRKRLEVMERDNFTFKNCQCDNKTLHVHHVIYKKGLEPWEYDNIYLKTLCHECHEEEEYNKKVLQELIEKCYIAGETSDGLITLIYHGMIYEREKKEVENG